MKKTTDLFIGVYPSGIQYADKRTGRNLAFLSFHTLELRFEADCPEGWQAIIRADASCIQARKGEEYVVSASGQTVLLGEGAA